MDPATWVRSMNEMTEWLLPVLIIAAYIVLMRWVLPRLGVPT